MTRNTSTGKTFHETVLSALDDAGYNYEAKVNIGNKPNGRKQIVDLVIYKEDEKILVSKQWQQSDGTAEEKVPFEVIMLARACQEFNYQKAYLILGGTDHDKETDTRGWTLRKWYLSGGLKSWIQDHDLVIITGFEAFIAQVNRQEI